MSLLSAGVVWLATSGQVLMAVEVEVEVEEGPASMAEVSTLSSSSGLALIIKSASLPLSGAELELVEYQGQVGANACKV